MIKSRKKISGGQAAVQSLKKEKVEDVIPETLKAKDTVQVERTYLDTKSIKIKENPDDLLKRIRLNNKLKEEERIRMRKEQKALNPD